MKRNAIAMLWLLVTVLSVLYSSSMAEKAEPKPIHVDKVQVYHFLVRHWVSSFYEGDQQCGPHLQCEWTWSEQIHRLHLEHGNYEKHGSFSGKSVSPATATAAGQKVIVNNSVSIGVYNIHSLWEKKRDHAPLACELRTNLNLVESEESRVRYGHLFNPSFKNFDGYSTTSPQANVQRVYKEVRLNTTEFYPLRNFTSMIKGASYVASDCHARDGANAGRDGVVVDIRNQGFRVDGLGRCLSSPVGPEGVQLSKDRASRYKLELKRAVISNFMFNMAFENSLEPGYVTEKPFDALMSGTVPVYLGDSTHLKKIMPYPKAVIYLSDWNNNVTALVQYLNYLTKNESAYEEHREWRKHYSLANLKKYNPLIGVSWPCAVCQWAVDHAHLHHKRVRHCKEAAGGKPATEIRDVSQYNGKVVRGSGREVYLVEKSILRPIPDLNTLFSLNISLASIKQIPEKDFTSMKLGEGVPKAEKEFAEVQRV